MAAVLAKPLLLFPCNGNAVEALDCLGERYRARAFIDDAAEKQGTSCCGVPVGGRSLLATEPAARLLAVPGSPATYLGRRRLIEGLAQPPERFATVIHPAARVSPLARIGRNVLVMAGVVVTSNAVIGDHVCILPNTVVHHDVEIGAWTLIGSGVSIAGGCRIGRNCYIGSAASVRNGIEVGDGCLVGLAATVLADVAAGCRVAGSPARTLGAAVAAVGRVG